MVWDDGYKFFAGHDCELYDLKLTVMMSRYDWAQNIMKSTTGIETQMHEFKSIGAGDCMMSFILTPEANTLGIWLSEDSMANIHYDTAWQYHENNM